VKLWRDFKQEIFGVRVNPKFAKPLRCHTKLGWYNDEVILEVR